MLFSIVSSLSLLFLFIFIPAYYYPVERKLYKLYCDVNSVFERGETRCHSNTVVVPIVKVQYSYYDDEKGYHIIQ